MSQVGRKSENPMVHKVFKLDHEYVCSICRSVHASHDRALQCLESCWSKVLDLPPVVVKHGAFGAADHFRCRFCGRDYQRADEANRCAHECREMKIEKFQHDADIFRNNRPVLMLRDTGFSKKPRSAFTAAVKKAPSWKRSAPKPEISANPSVSSEEAIKPPEENGIAQVKADGTEEDAMEFKREEDEMVV